MLKHTLKLTLRRLWIYQKRSRKGKPLRLGLSRECGTSNIRRFGSEREKGTRTAEYEDF